MNPQSCSRRRFNQMSLLAAGSLLAYPGTSWGADTAQQNPNSGSARAAKSLSDEPLPFVDGSFTIVALPDTQKYTRNHPQHFYEQTRWIAANKENYNIAFVVQLGDITDNNIPTQWAVARKALSTLDGVVPYSILPGNHDYGRNGLSNDRSTFLPEYFSADDVRKQPTCGGLFNPKRPDSSYHTFSVNDQHFLVLALEWGPSDEVVEWANEIVAKHPEHHAILTTHAYMFHDNTRHDWVKYGRKQRWNPHEYENGKAPGSANDGQELWEKLVSKHKNFFLTLNGHVLFDGQGRLTSEAETGNQVHQVLTNYQNRAEGGHGFMRLIEFLPDGKTVQMKTYSPSLDKFKTDEDGQHQFVLTLSPDWNT